MTRPRVTGGRQPDLEGLRAIASLMVFASHLPWYQYYPGGLWAAAPSWLSPRAPIFGAGGFAVVLFLVLSGTGLCRLLVLKAPPLVRYLRDRLGKLYSIYWSIAVPVLVISFAITWLPLSQLPGVGLLLAGLALTPTTFGTIFPSWWYMGIAWQVVVAAPLLVLGMRRIRPVGVLVLTALVVLGTCWAVPALHLDYAEKALVFCRALEVLGGMFLALEMWPEVRERLGVSRRHAAWLVAGTIACLVALLATGLGGRWLYRAAGLALVAIVVYAHPIERWGARRLGRIAVYGGGFSFAVYLIHEPVLLVMRRLTGAPAGISIGTLALISLPVVGLLAVLCTEGVARIGKSRARRMTSSEGGAA
ncbi:MAG TPA: acyltransferase [Coriobacteriia bacterium]